MVPLLYDSFDLLPEPTEKYDWLDAGPFRAAFERSGLTYSDVARAAGRLRHGGVPDPSSVRKALSRTEVSYETAVMLCRGLDMPPHELGV